MARSNIRITVSHALNAYREPAHTLAAAVIVQTIQDVRGVQCTREEQQAARAFLYDGWFDCLCDGIGIDPFRVRELVGRETK